ncbi:MAG: hypothetical protein AAFN77_10575 [Planctomycetota bacterium]
MEDWLPFVIIGVMIVGVGGIIYWSYLADKKRTEQLAENAEAMGLTFIPDGGDGLLHRFSGFQLFNRGRSRRIRNVITGDAGDVAIAIFDYRFTTGSGKHKTTHNQTIVSLSSSNFHAPDLYLRPEGFFDKIGSAIGFQDIDFESHPEFSRLFVLKGSNEMAIRQFMKPAVLELLETKQGICLEADGNTMFFYKNRTSAKPDQIKDLLAEAYEIYNCVTDEMV